MQDTLKKFEEKIWRIIFELPSLQSQITREFSSAGSEHLPYKQRVGGSNPSTPTEKRKAPSKGAFLFWHWA
jgi:hypothetical protein